MKENETMLLMDIANAMGSDYYYKSALEIKDDIVNYCTYIYEDQKDEPDIYKTTIDLNVKEAINDPKFKVLKAYREWEDQAKSKFVIEGDPSCFESLIFSIDNDRFFQIGYSEDSNNYFFNDYTESEPRWDESDNPNKLNEWLDKINNYNHG